jgi:hypothetical protein
MPLPGEGVVNPRNEIMAEIQKARQEQLAQEFKEGGGDLAALEPADKPAVEPEVKAETPEGEAPAGEAEKTEGEVVAEAPPVEEPVKPKVKIKVDGQELEVDEEAVREAGIKALQKQSAADKRLEESARLKKEAEAEARRILEDAKRQAAQPNQDVTQPPQQGATSVERLTDDRFIETVKKVQYGGEAEAGQALKDLISEAVKAGKSPELTLNEVGEYLEFREATKWAHDEYKEILGDSKLKTLFSSEEKRLRATGDMRPYREVYSDIGNGLREWLKEKVPTPTPAAPPTRQERKASVVVIPTAAARQPAPTQPKEPSPSEVIDRIRAARHQA